jgi:uncharacterized protein (TIGR03437 family)
MTRFTASKGGARAIFLLVVSSPACFAQGPTAFGYQNPVTTDDGSRLFFISINRLAGTEESFRWKLFSWDAASGVQLAYDPPPEQSVTGISITGDGSLAAVRTVAGRDLLEGILLHTDTGEVEPVGKTAIISRNGRYLFTGDAVLDRVAGTSRPAPYLGAIVVGSDGSLLYTVRSGNSTTVHRSDPDGMDRAVVSVPYGLIGDFDENLTKVVVQSNYGYDPPVVFNTITGQQVDLGAVGALGGADAALLSSDGQWVTLDTYSGVKLCHADASGCRLLTTEGNSTTPIAISRNASSVYAFQYLHQVLHIDTITSRTEQAFVVPGFVFPEQTPPLVAGSLVQLENASPVTNVTLNRQEIQILARSEGMVIVQIPWEATDQGAVSFPLTDYAPRPFPGMPLGNTTNAYRQDWSATAIDSPANPGEVVHVYAVGLGPVDCAVETNKPAPLDRLCPITRTVHWNWISPFGTSPAEVLFAGLAPGLIGVYQADIRIPRDAASGAYIELWVEPGPSGENPRLRHLTTVLVRSPG